MGRRQHHPRREHRPRSDPQTQSGQSHRHRRIPAQQGGFVKHEVSHNRARQRRLDAHCGAHSIAAPRRMSAFCPRPAASSNRSAAAAILRSCACVRNSTAFRHRHRYVFREIELQLAWESTPAPAPQALKTAARNIRAFADAPAAEGLRPEAGRRGDDWPARRPARLRRLLHPQRPLSAAVHAAHDRRFPRRWRASNASSPSRPIPRKETLAAAYLLGITEFYRVGGAHAIAALAYGTETIPRVDKIVGPGNAWVTAAKKLVAFDCSIDMLAGPTEAVITSETGDPAADRRRSRRPGRTRPRHACHLHHHRSRFWPNPSPLRLQKRLAATQ